MHTEAKLTRTKLGETKHNKEQNLEYDKNLSMEKHWGVDTWWELNRQPDNEWMKTQTKCTQVIRGRETKHSEHGTPDLFKIKRET